MLVVPDVLRDPRFADNPYVTDGPHIRFYAGQPLKAADGSRVGTLCIIDRRPRDLSAAELAPLRDLAAWVEHELLPVERDRVLRRLGESEERYRSLVEEMPVITYVVAIDDQSSTIYTSPQIEPILGFTQDDGWPITSAGSRGSIPTIATVCLPRCAPRR
jgi:GAF domain-containing protein